jgi:hypothetical protein
MRLAITLSLLAACAKPSSEPPPAPAVIEATAPEHGTATDLTKSPTAKLEAVVSPQEPWRHRVTAVGKLDVKVTQTGGELGKLTVTVSEWQGKPMMLSSDSMTCAEPACSLGLPDLSTAHSPLFVDIEVSATMSLRLELSSAVP